MEHWVHFNSQMITSCHVLEGLWQVDLKTEVIENLVKLWRLAYIGPRTAQSCILFRCCLHSNLFTAVGKTLELVWVWFNTSTCLKVLCTKSQKHSCMVFGTVGCGVLVSLLDIYLFVGLCASLITHLELLGLVVLQSLYNGSKPLFVVPLCSNCHGSQNLIQAGEKKNAGSRFVDTEVNKHFYHLTGGTFIHNLKLKHHVSYLPSCVGGDIFSAKSLATLTNWFPSLCMKSTLLLQQYPILTLSCSC